MSTATTNYGFNLPAVADPIDEDLWGTELNTNFSSLDDILPTPAANKYGAIAVQNNTDDGLEYITSQGTSGQILASNGGDALPSFQSVISLVGAVVYPIGSYYFNETDSTNPGTLLGFGTWTAVTDKFIVAKGSTYVSTGGAATVTIGAGNLPALSVSANYWNSASAPSGGSFNSTTKAAGGIAGLAPLVDTTLSNVVNAGSANTPISIIPTYQAVYVWKRTA